MILTATLAALLIAAPKPTATEISSPTIALAGTDSVGWDGNEATRTKWPGTTVVADDHAQNLFYWAISNDGKPAKIVKFSIQNAFTDCLSVTQHSDDMFEVWIDPGMISPKAWHEVTPENGDPWLTADLQLAAICADGTVLHYYWQTRPGNDYKGDHWKWQMDQMHEIAHGKTEGLPCTFMEPWCGAPNTVCFYSCEGQGEHMTCQCMKLSCGALCIPNKNWRCEYVPESGWGCVYGCGPYDDWMDCFFHCEGIIED